MQTCIRNFFRIAFPRVLSFPVLLLTAITFLCGCRKNVTTEIREDFNKYYRQFNVSGSFALYDLKNKHYILYNPSQFTETFIPASTFKICNTLIGLETGVIKDENFVIPWDQMPRNPVWDKDHDLKTAFKNSTVWYYQELARRVGGKRMKYWIDKANYGNCDTTGGIDKFWLDGKMRISPQQQINFLERLHENQLPFSQRSVDITKKIMIQSDTLNIVVRGKKGWGLQDGNEVGWYIGYVTTPDNVFYFSNCIQLDTQTMNNPQRAAAFDQSRMAITYRILHELNVLP